MYKKGIDKIPSVYYNKDRIKKGDSKMKANGVVRRMDDLMKVPIPKEFRNVLKIEVGTPLELDIKEVDGEKCLVVKKFSFLNVFIEPLNEWLDEVIDTLGDDEFASKLTEKVNEIEKMLRAWD